MISWSIDILLNFPNILKSYALTRSETSEATSLYNV